ncbi:hypothetical protein [Campylobacter canadensis]|uniref:hypothetical protein n=1 Tax=Campylobacter canadensis TaxID=449520 RepID=UPI001CCF8AFF|nr:hypothetical protein [Campylobacter canadensis]MBZ8002740.1 hypothetical protein [Campylobacter canadensis]
MYRLGCLFESENSEAGRRFFGIVFLNIHKHKLINTTKKLKQTEVFISDDFKEKICTLIHQEKQSKYVKSIIEYHTEPEKYNNKCEYQLFYFRYISDESKSGEFNEQFVIDEFEKFTKEGYEAELLIRDFLLKHFFTDYKIEKFNLFYKTQLETIKEN